MYPGPHITKTQECVNYSKSHLYATILHAAIPLALESDDLTSKSLEPKKNMVV